MDTEKTRQLFAPLIVRPPLTDQLLERPPFKFLHDIVNATVQNTGFLVETFTADELDSTTMKDKTAKVQFLQKLIKALNNDGSLKSVKAVKIVAGKEPELTNLLLQKLATDASAYQSGEGQSQPLARNGSAMKDRGVEDQKEKKEKKSRHHDKKEKGDRSEKKKERSSSRDHDKKESKEKRHSSRSKDKASESSTKKRSKVTVGNEKENENSLIIRRTSVDEGHYDDGEVETTTKDEEAGRADDEPSGTAKTEDSGIADDLGNEAEPMPPPAAQRQQNRLMTASGRPQTSMGRPGTAMARPAPPKLKKKQIEEVERKVEPVAETSAVIVGERNEEDEDFVVEADPAIDHVDREDADQLVSNEHGGLVRKILETKKELEAGIDEETSKFSTSVFDENERERSRKEVDKMQRAIQQLAQTTHPLARLFDYAQEDVDSMMKELGEWRNETKRNSMEVRERGANSVDSAERLLIALKELEDEIKEMRASIAHTKANIITNEHKIRTLIHNL